MRDTLERDLAGLQSQLAAEKTQRAAGNDKASQLQMKLAAAQQQLDQSMAREQSHSKEMDKLSDRLVAVEKAKVRHGLSVFYLSSNLRKNLELIRLFPETPVTHPPPSGLHGV